MKGQRNIEQYIETLRHIKNLNSKREKNKAFKVPIIFIKNGEDLNPGENGNILFQELKNILEKHELLDLYDSDKNNN